MTELEYAKSLLKRIRDNCVEPWQEASFMDVRAEIDHYFLGVPDEHFTVTEARRKAPEELEAIIEWIECEEFYNLMQAYRLAGDHATVLEAYRAVKRFIAGEILEDRSPNSTRSPRGALLDGDLAEQRKIHDQSLPQHGSKG